MPLHLLEHPLAAHVLTLLREKVSQLPLGPGVYLYKDAADNVR